jgi:hypothetical protein
LPAYLFNGPPSPWTRSPSAGHLAFGLRSFNHLPYAHQVMAGGPSTSPLSAAPAISGQKPETYSPSPDPSSLSLPIISISPYLRDSDSSPSQLEARQAVASALHRACLEYGFFYLDISAYVDPRDPMELTELAREFFSSPQEVKDKISIANQDYARGECSQVTYSPVIVWTQGCRARASIFFFFLE